MGILRVSKVVRILQPFIQSGIPQEIVDEILDNDQFAGCVGIVLEIRGDDVLVETETDKVWVHRERLRVN